MCLGTEVEPNGTCRLERPYSKRAMTAILIGTRTRQIEHCAVDYLGNVDFKFVSTLN